MPEVWCWYEKVYGRSRSSWSAVRVDAGKHVDFCRGFVLSSAEKIRLLILRPTRHTGALLFHRVMPVSDGKPRSVSTRLVFLGLDPALLASDRPVLPSGADVLDVLRAWIIRRRGRGPLYLTYFGKALGRSKEERSPSQYVRTNVRRLMVS